MKKQAVLKEGTLVLGKMILILFQSNMRLSLLFKQKSQFFLNPFNFGNPNPLINYCYEKNNLSFCQYGNSSNLFVLWLTENFS